MKYIAITLIISVICYQNPKTLNSIHYITDLYLKVGLPFDSSRGCSVAFKSIKGRHKILLVNVNSNVGKI